MPLATVVHTSKEKFQEQYGTLFVATEAYLDGAMQPMQARSFEVVVDVAFIAAVAQTRLFHELVQWMKQA